MNTLKTLEAGDAHREIKRNKVGEEITVNLYHDRKLLATMGSVVVM